MAKQTELEQYSIFCQMQMPAPKLAPGGADARPGKFKIEGFY